MMYSAIGGQMLEIEAVAMTSTVIGGNARGLAFFWDSWSRRV
jgi:hypothetical protein